MPSALKAALFSIVAVLASSSSLRAASPYRIQLQKSFSDSAEIPSQFRAVLICSALQAKPGSEKTTKLRNGMYSVSFGDNDFIESAKSADTVLLTDKVWSDSSKWPLLFEFKDGFTGVGKMGPVQMFYVGIRYQWQDSNGISKTLLNKQLLVVPNNKPTPLFYIKAVKGTAVGGPPVKFQVTPEEL